MKVTQSCPILCNPMDYTVHGILQARILEWVAFPSPEDLLNPRIEPRSPTLQVNSLPAEPQGKPLLSKLKANPRPRVKAGQMVYFSLFSTKTVARSQTLVTGWLESKSGKLKSIDPEAECPSV